MKKYNLYAEAARHRKRDETTIFDMNSGNYKNVKVWTESRRTQRKIKDEIIKTEKYKGYILQEIKIGGK